MIYVILLLICLAAILYGLVFGLAIARISVILLAKGKVDIKEVSIVGAVFGGFAALISGFALFYFDPNPGFKVERIETLFLITTGFTLIVPVFVCICLVIAKTWKLTTKTVDWFFDRQE